MRMRLAAFAACIVAFVVAWPATAADSVVPRQTVTLDDAFMRVADSHPDLRLFGGHVEDRDDSVMPENPLNSCR